MYEPETGTLHWFTSSASGANGCVEIAHLPGSARVALRDSKDPAREPFRFNRQEWAAFLIGARAGESGIPA